MDMDGNGYISFSELKEALDIVGIKLPGHEVRELIRKHDTIVHDGRLDMEEFKQVRRHLFLNSIQREGIKLILEH